MDGLTNLMVPRTIFLVTGAPRRSKGCAAYCLHRCALIETVSRCRAVSAT